MKKLIQIIMSYEIKCTDNTMIWIAAAIFLIAMAGVVCKILQGISLHPHVRPY